MSSDGQNKLHIQHVQVKMWMCYTAFSHLCSTCSGVMWFNGLRSGPVKLPGSNLTNICVVPCKAFAPRRLWNQVSNYDKFVAIYKMELMLLRCKFAATRLDFCLGLHCKHMLCYKSALTIDIYLYIDL